MGIEFTRLSIRNYRRLHHVDLELRPLNVLIGANGSGKTSILEVMELLAGSAQGKLHDTISADGGLNSLLTHNSSPEMKFQVFGLAQKELPMEYSLTLRTSGLGYEISRESLVQYIQMPNPQEPYSIDDDYAGVDPQAQIIHLLANGSDIRYRSSELSALELPTWDHHVGETGLAQVPKQFPSPENFRRTLASLTLYHALDVSPRAPVRLPQQMQPTDSPGRNGEDLCPYLYSLSQTHPNRYEALEDALKAAFPNFEALRFPPVATGTLSLAWKDRSFSKPFHPHQLSEGTLRFLWLASLLQSPQLPAVLIVDEPEVSLHPEMLRLLVDLLREASTRTQIIVATHSDRFVRFLEPEELVVCDTDGIGRTHLQRAEGLDIQQWLDKYSLDELWSNGRLGGRP